MIDKKTVFVLGAGASCPYGYPSGARLRKRIVMGQEFISDFESWKIQSRCTPAYETQKISEFRNAFDKSHIDSIDKFMANNPKLAPIGKYIVAFEIFRAEKTSFFSEAEKLEQENQANAHNCQFGLSREPIFFQGEDWYFYLYNQLIEGLVGPKALPDFSNGKLAFITFNYDRSLEQFFYEALRNSFTEIQEEEITKTLRQLKILHVYGQITPLKWQDPNNGVDYKPGIDETLLWRAANNIRTIYEEKQNLESTEAQDLLTQAEQIFFLGFGYAEENLEVLKPPDRIKRPSWIYGTAFGLEKGELNDCRNKIIEWLPVDDSARVKVENMDCLKLLKNYF